MKVLVDLQSCQSPSRIRGIGRYSWDLFDSLLDKMESEHEVHVLINESFVDEAIELRAKLEGRVDSGRIHTFPSLKGASGVEHNESLRKCAEVIRETKIKSIDPDYVLLTSLFEGWGDMSVTSIPKNTGIPTGVVLYDLIPYLNQDMYLPSCAHKDWYESKLEELKNADCIFSISESSRDEAIQHLGIDPSSIVNISTAVSKVFYQIESTLDSYEIGELLGSFELPDDFILYTGNLDARKNIKGLLSAYAKLPASLRKRYPLVIVTKIDHQTRNKFNTQLGKLGIDANSCIFTGYVNDRVLAALYARCSLFVFPSLHEGFGLPCLEAMLFNAPVIASNCTSIPEVVSLKQALFNPHDPTDISTKMLKALTDDDFRNALIENGKRRVKEFSWDTTSQVMFENLISRKATSKSSLHDSCYKTAINSLGKYVCDKRVSELENISYCLDRVLPVNTNELLVDITNLYKFDEKTGIQRVVKEVSKRILFLDSPYDIRLVYMNDKCIYEYASDYEYTLGVYKDKTGVVEPVKGDIFFGLDLLADKYSTLEILFKRWRARGVTISSVVYDIIPILYPEFFHDGIKTVFPDWLKVIIETNDKIISISETVSHDIQNYALKEGLEGPLSTKYCYQHLGADFISSPAQCSYSKSNTKNNNVTLLMVGTIEPRKGHIDIIKAMQHFKTYDSTIRLIVIGKAGWHTEDEQKLLTECNESSESNIKWLSNCNDDELEQWYLNADAIVASSYAEGFGLPLIEASSKGIPIIARDIDIFREVANEHAFYFSNTKDSKVIFDQLCQWLALYKDGQHPKSSGVLSLTWDEVTKSYLNKIVSGRL
ncbi:glycosyltransferase family 4 protein [Vibrio cholerae]